MVALAPQRSTSVNRPSAHPTARPDFFVSSGDVQLAVTTWGPREDQGRLRPVMVLVHGFPDTAQLWREVAPRLAERFHVVAYDVRGAGQSTAVRGFWRYRYKHLTQDLLAVVNAVSPTRSVHLVGHDWGALQGWDAVAHPSLKGRIASFSAATPSLDHVGLWFRRRLLRPTPRHVMELGSQLLRNAFMFFFHLPLVPELLWRLGGGAALLKASYEHLEGLKLQAAPTLNADGRHALGLYRANMLPHLLRPKPAPLSLPIQALIAQGDVFVPPWLFESLEGAQHLTRTTLPGGHFAPLSQPDAFAAAVGRFALKQGGGRA